MYDVCVFNQLIMGTMTLVNLVNGVWLVLFVLQNFSENFEKDQMSRCSYTIYIVK